MDIQRPFVLDSFKWKCFPLYMDRCSEIISLCDRKINLFGKYIMDIIPPTTIKLISNIDELEHQNTKEDKVYVFDFHTIPIQN